jgi:MoaA/NifB/PqqE/SkfB family radical SAM enzyme
LHITGGEPSVYPGFVELCRVLSQDHILSLNSNFSHTSIVEFAQTISPQRVSFINASLHYDERTARNSLDPFFQRVRMLRDCGFNVMVTAVMTPIMVRDFAKVKEIVAGAGINPIPKILRGPYKGNIYPIDYTREERDVIARELDALQKDLASLKSGELRRMVSVDLEVDRNAIASQNWNLLKLKRYITGSNAFETRFRGRLCAAGMSFVSLLPDGTVTRCSNETVLGNLLDGSIKFFTEPKPCDTSFCMYFCEKYSSPVELRRAG